MSRKEGKGETAIYMIDADHRIVHFNEALRRVFPAIQAGDVCYRALCGEESVCASCPLRGGRNDSAIFYNKWLRKWLEVSTGEIEWPGSGLCDIVMAREIREDNKNLFYNLTSISTYDELFELNLTGDTYKILYHLKGKYVIPATEGRLAAMVGDVVENMIHPDDREACWRSGIWTACFPE